MLGGTYVALHSALKYVCLVFSYGTVFYQSSFTTFWRNIWICFNANPH